jgi:hypothetical protein
VRTVARRDGCCVGLLDNTICRTEMEMMRMVKSTVCTLNCPNHPLAIQAGDAGICGLPV